jgi:C4-dicarboxylate-specific signal transduction histidine kinase
MFFLWQVLPLPHYKEALIDATLLSIVVFPTLYFLVFKPLSSQEDKLVEINENLESLVRERTKELDITNKNLRQEIAKKEKIEIEHNKLETQFVQIQKLEAIGLLAGGIAHDFNNLLTPILAYSEMAILELPENSKVRKNIKAVHSAGEKAAEITQQLLAFSRKQPLEIQAINLYEIVTNITG